MITIQELYEIFKLHPSVSTDSRRITQGCIFFALHGDKFDGNDFALQALADGAAYAVVDDERLTGDDRLLFVEDTLLALQELAALHRASMPALVIGITGTNGKTTTKELTAAVLSTTFRMIYTEGNLNNHIGVPLTLLRLEPEHELALIEMGASKPDDIDELCQIAQPNYGLITNIGEAHLEGFGSIVGVERTKAELYQWLRTHEGKCFRREEDERLTRLSREIPAVTYGQSSEAVVIGHSVPSADGMSLSVEWQVPTLDLDNQRIDTHLVGAYNLDNVLAAISIGLFLGVPSEAINRAIADYTPTNSRSQYIQSERNDIIADAYNANPSSMAEAIRNVFAIDSPRPRLLILGDMNELGAESTAAHERIYNLIRELRQPSTSVVLVGRIWSMLNPEGAVVLPDTNAVLTYINEQKPTGHLALVKGSNGIGLSSILPSL